jgi:predicted O-methyltransferase YrrM
LDAALADAKAAGMPEISVSALQGKMLMVLAKAMGAKRILEIGTLAAFSTIWMARALPKDGKLISLEFEPKHRDVAQKNLRRAGFAEQIEIMLGPAAESMKKLIAAKTEPFDFIFIDADKGGYAEYLKLAIELSRSGTLIVADNVVRDGEVANAKTEDESAQGIRKYNEVLAREPRVTASIVQTVGTKGHDGFTIAVVN